VATALLVAGCTDLLDTSACIHQLVMKDAMESTNLTKRPGWSCILLMPKAR